MPITQINLKLDFHQVLDLVKQLSKNEQRQLLDFIETEESKPKKFTEKEEAFLSELDEAVEFVNNYPKGKESSTTFKQMLDAL